VTGRNEQSVRIEQTQEQTQSGVCVEAFTSGEVVTVADLELESRWPEFRSVAREVGVRATAAVPMRLGGEALGALNLYDDKPRQWTEHDMSTATVLADMATSYLVNASEIAESRRRAEQLEEALETRIIIEQAKGVLANERKVSVDQAFEILRRHARTHQAGLRTVADAVVNLGLRP
jgi:GAF domain-containing protein